MASEDVFVNFGRLLRRADRLLHRLGPPQISLDESDKGEPDAEAVSPSLPDRAPACTTLAAVVTPMQSACELPKHGGIVGGNLALGRLSLDPRPLFLLGNPTFVRPHNVVIEESSKEAVECEGQREFQGNGLNTRSAKRGPGSATKITHTSRCDEHVKASSFESDSTDCSSSDKSWQPGTEFSPSSVEFLSHVDTSSSPSESYCEFEEIQGSRQQRRSSPISTTGIQSLVRDLNTQRSLDFGALRSSATKRRQRFGRQVGERTEESLGAHLQCGQALEMPKKSMGKEKETFEPWSKPKRGKKVVSEKKTSEVAEKPIPKTRAPKQKSSVLMPKGMKKSSIVGNLKKKGSLLNEPEEFSKEGDVTLSDVPNNNAPAEEVVTRRGARKRMSFANWREDLSDDADGLEPVFSSQKHMAAEFGMEVEEGDSIGRIPELRRPVKEDVFKRRSGMKKAVTSHAVEDHVKPHHHLPHMQQNEHRRRTINRDFSPSDSEMDVHESRPWGKEVQKEHRDPESEDSGGRSSSLSPPRHGRGHRRGNEESGQRGQSTKSPEVRKRSGKHVGRLAGRGSSSDSFSDRDDDRDRRRRMPVHSASPEFHTPVRKQRDFSRDSESGSSDEAGQQSHYLSDVKRKKLEVGSPRDETRKRQERRTRQGERESERRQRERQGLKGHYISVDIHGIPYGFGVGAWRSELNKLCTSLDPSVTNIRYQPEKSMATLRCRLKDNFEYSGPVDRAYIRKLAGKVVTQRRSRILNSMKDGELCPDGMDKEIWRRLDRIRQDPSREELSQRMKYANASRVHKGRTGPKGENGVREDLYRKLGREADPDEVEFEMRRKKGYEGVSKSKRARKERSASLSSDKEVCEELEGSNGVKVDAHDGGTMTLFIGERSPQKKHLDVEYVRRMEYEILQLRAAMKASKKMTLQAAVGDVGACSSMPTGGPESEATGAPPDEERSVKKLTGKGKEVVRDGTPSPPRKFGGNRRP